MKLTSLTRAMPRIQILGAVIFEKIFEALHLANVFMLLSSWINYEIQLNLFFLCIIFLSSALNTRLGTLLIPPDLYDALKCLVRCIFFSVLQ